MSNIGLEIVEDDEDDPIISVVNIVDIFLVIIAVLLIIIMSSPVNPFNQEDDVIVITNPGQDNMTIMIKKGDELTQYESSGQIGEGQGAKAGTAYRLDDGRMIYVPE